MQMPTLNKGDTANVPASEQFRNEKIALLKSLNEYHRNWNMDLVSDAFDFGAEMHKNQKRQTGEPYFTHPIAVTGILIELKTDYIAVTAALLHDVIEDCNVTVEELTDKFGPTVALLVDGVTKISERNYISVEERQADVIHRVLLSTLKDLRVIIIKFADRLHNMKTIGAMSKKSRMRIAKETRNVYVPLAHRFGMGRIARDLEDLTLKILHPKAYNQIAKMISSSVEEREESLQQLIGPIRQELEKANLPAHVFGRVKSMSSIYDKIHRREKELNEILDLLAIRIIVKHRSECYRALGLVHDIFKPIKGFFTDYIALPKSNLYQSLHTKVRDEAGRIVEIQIRTEEMDIVSENGIAAHWKYKEGNTRPDELDETFDWIRLLMESHQEEAETGEFLASLKINLFQDEIFVFTPKGKLVKLPRGATPIDYAYAIHSDIGNHTIAAKVKGKMVALSHELESSDVVEILTSPNQFPSAQWLQFVRTGRARNRIKQWLRKTKWDQGKALGEEMITQEISRLKLQTDNGELTEIALGFGCDDLDGLYADLGSGKLSLTRVMNKLVPKLAPDKNSLISRVIRIRQSNTDGVRISGWDNMVVSVAECCNPLPGEQIIGFQEYGKGLTVHRTDCPRSAKLIDQSHKVIAVTWDVERAARFEARVTIVADDRPNLLRDITLCVASVNVNMNRIELSVDGKLANGVINVMVRNLPHLTKLINKINRIQGVLRVERKDIETVESTDVVSQAVATVS